MHRCPKLSGPSLNCQAMLSSQWWGRTGPQQTLLPELKKGPSTDERVRGIQVSSCPNSQRWWGVGAAGPFSHVPLGSVRNWSSVTNCSERGRSPSSPRPQGPSVWCAWRPVPSLLYRGTHELPLSTRWESGSQWLLTWKYFIHDIKYLGQKYNN